MAPIRELNPEQKLRANEYKRVTIDSALYGAFRQYVVNLNNHDRHGRHHIVLESWIHVLIWVADGEHIDDGEPEDDSRKTMFNHDPALRSLLTDVCDINPGALASSQHKAKSILEHWPEVLTKIGAVDDLDTELQAGDIDTKNDGGTQAGGPGKSYRAAKLERRAKRARKPNRKSRLSSLRAICYPPEDEDDEIWGEGGYMCGLALAPPANLTQSPTRCLDDHYEPDTAFVYGHAKAAPGDFYPFQLCAKFYGVVGDPEDAVTAQLAARGSAEAAYAIVVAGPGKHGINKDYGDEIWYAREVHIKEATQSKIKTGALYKSAEPGAPPVRVIRTVDKEEAAQETGREDRDLSSGDINNHGPIAGFRYDGLYQVIDVKEESPDSDDMVTLFRLVRLNEDGSYTKRSITSNAEPCFAQKSLDDCKALFTNEEQLDIMRRCKARFAWYERIIKDRMAAENLSANAEPQEAGVGADGGADAMQTES